LKKKAFIGGEWRETEESFEVRSPFDGEVLAEVCFANAEESAEAIAISETAATEMGLLPRFQIAAGLRKISEGIENRKSEFSESIAMEAAKPINIARGEVERGIATFRWAASEAERFTGEVVPLVAPSGGENKFGYTLCVPKGVIYGITPFNFPLNLVAHKVAPALAAGNSIIIKPSEKTPLTALLLGEVYLDCGLPKGAFQVVPMSVEYINRVLSDDRVKMISFTGSDKVGWELKKKCGRKAIALELGGNAPIIVDETADVQTVADKAVIGAFAYSGQVCISAQRLLVHRDIAVEFTKRFVEKTKKLLTGDPLEESTQISALIDENSAVRAKSWIDQSLNSGAKLLCGGMRNGSFLEPTVLTNVDPGMRVVSEEVFAPVAVIEYFSDFEEGIALANSSRFGLQASVFTENLRNFRYASENLQYGGVIINDVPTFRVDNMPYGGVKESGFGREGVKYAMREMSDTRLIVLNS
jgi:acyl-CoA reductase-like NAD-dependent aldehyde dehydrogenase